jgi:hypothetical protein
LPSQADPPRHDAHLMAEASVRPCTAVLRGWIAHGARRASEERRITRPISNSNLHVIASVGAQPGGLHPLNLVREACASRTSLEAGNTR